MDYLDVVVHVFTPRDARVLPARAALGRGPARRAVEARREPAGAAPLDDEEAALTGGLFEWS